MLALVPLLLLPSLAVAGPVASKIEECPSNPAPCLGAKLPDGVSRDEIVRLVVPADQLASADAVNLVGAVPWKARPGSLVAVVQAGGTGTMGGRSWLGVIERTAGGPRLVARTEQPFVPRSDWGLLDGDGPVQEPGDEELVRFDLARYVLTGDRDVAIGLRTLAYEGYAGGGAEFEALHLFRLEGTRLVHVLDVPIRTYKLIAGEWHDDGTRDHEEEMTRLVLVVEKTSTGGVHDLTIRPCATCPPRFRATWDRGHGRYRVERESSARSQAGTK